MTAALQLLDAHVTDEDEIDQALVMSSPREQFEALKTVPYGSLPLLPRLEPEPAPTAPVLPMNFAGS